MRQKHKKKLSKEKRAMLDTINQTREKAPMPRPTYFSGMQASMIEIGRNRWIERKFLNAV